MATKKGDAAKAAKKATSKRAQPRKKASLSNTKKAPAKKAPTRKKRPTKKAPSKKKKKKKAPSKKTAPLRAQPLRPKWLEGFARVLPPGSVAPAPEHRLAELKARVPPSLIEAWRITGWGWFGGGFLLLCDPADLDDTLAKWLGGANPNRIALGRTALGDLIYFRDLRERARLLGLSGEEAESACDVSLVDVRYKRVQVLAHSVESFFAEVLGDEQELRDSLRKDLFDAASDRLGAPNRDEVYGFVPALALGGSERPDNLQRVNLREHLAILFQL